MFCLTIATGVFYVFVIHTQTSAIHVGILPDTHNEKKINVKFKYNVILFNVLYLC